VAHVYVRINQSRDEKPTRSINSPSTWTHTQVCTDLSDPAVSDNDIGVEQRGSTLWRDQRDIFDYRAVADDAPRGR
jgi:hypothetical protein